MGNESFEENKWKSTSDTKDLSEIVIDKILNDLESYFKLNKLWTFYSSDSLDLAQVLLLKTIKVVYHVSNQQLSNSALIGMCLLKGCINCY